MTEPIPNHKTECAAMAPPGWKYVGFDNGRYLFQSGSYDKGFKLLEANAEDLTRENLALMARMGVTR